MIGLMLMVMLLAACPGYGAQDMDWGESLWSWDEVFSRSPEAVREQLNYLMKEFRKKEGGLKGIYFKWVNNIGEKEFCLVGKDGRSPVANRHIQVRVDGCTNRAGEVETLRVRCRPVNGLTADFDEESFQLMRMALMALFDKDDKRQGDALSLLYIYDLRPYLYEKGDVRMPALKRDADTVADGLYVQAIAESKDDELCLTVTIGDTAQDQQVGAARLNDQSNRVLDQSIGELVILKECAWELASILPDVQKDEMVALLDQMTVGLSAIRELNMNQYSKCQGYAQALDGVMQRLDALILELHQWINQPDTAAGEALEARMLEQVNQIKQLSELIQMC
jgi:hypothetical protein